jgi:Spy/CpxP family protein refolding chaperone
MHRNFWTSSLLLAAVVAALIAAVAGPATAGLTAPPMEPGVAPAVPGPIAAFLHCLGVVGLTDQQKADAKAILEAEKPVLEGLVGQRTDDGKSLQGLLQAATKDPCAIGSALLKVTADEKAIKDEFVKIGTSLEALLTAEQKVRFQGCIAGTRALSATGDASGQ